MSYKHLVKKENGYITGYTKEYSNDDNYKAPQGWEVIDATSKEFKNYMNKTGDYTEEKVFNRTADYKEKRRKAYGSIGDQLDMIYWDKVNGTDEWKTHIETIKNQYPKE